MWLQRGRHGNADAATPFGSAKSQYIVVCRLVCPTNAFGHWALLGLVLGVLNLHLCNSRHYWTRGRDGAKILHVAGKPPSPSEANHRYFKLRFHHTNSGGFSTTLNLGWHHKNCEILAQIKKVAAPRKCEYS